MFNNTSQFYRSKEWEVVKRQAIERAMGKDGFVYDEINGEPITKQGDIIVHHIVPLTDDNVSDYDISLNLDNLKVVSFKHHNELHHRFGAVQRQLIYWVYGEGDIDDWLEGKFERDDIILSINRLRYAICDSEERSKATDNLVFGLRDCVLDMILTRRGKWNNAFIVTRYLDERICERLGAIPIEVIPPEIGEFEKG